MAGNVEEVVNADEIISTLPLQYFNRVPLRNYQGFWYSEWFLHTVISIGRLFNTPRPATDVFITSPPKSGANWLKALFFATVNRKVHLPSDPNHPLLHSPARNCVPNINIWDMSGRASEQEAVPLPRAMATHIPYQILPESITGSSSDCKIIYVCRNPKDVLVSAWHFPAEWTGPDGKPLPGGVIPFEEVFNQYCKGIYPYGPIWDHWLGYWKESLARPSKVLFVKYEDMKFDGAGSLKRVAEFVGCPFSEEEEREGVVDEIVRLCSFQNLKEVEANKSGTIRSDIVNAANGGVIMKNSSFFRKGIVGDWKNHFTSEMAKKLDEIVEEKLKGSGLCFVSDELKCSDGGH